MGKRVIFILVVFFCLSSPAFAQAEPAVAMELSALLPVEVQKMLEQGEAWNVQEFQKVNHDIVLLLEGKCKDSNKDAMKLYLLLQVPQGDWSSAESNLWVASDVSGYSFGSIPEMQVETDTVWLQFWKEGKFIVACIDRRDGNVKEKEFMNGLWPAPALSEHGVVGYDAAMQKLVFWDGEKEIVYPITQEIDKLVRAVKLNDELYYLDISGNFYCVTENNEQLLFNLQAYDLSVEGAKEPLAYISCANLFYYNDSLWMYASDWQLMLVPLLQYKNNSVTTYPITGLGRIHYVAPQVDGMQIIFDYYMPGSIPSGMLDISETQEQLSFCIIQNGEIKKQESYMYGQILTYCDKEGEVWKYNLHDDNIIFTQILKDGTEIGYGLEFQEPAIHVIFNGQEYQFDESPYIKNGHTMIPLRAVASLLGATVQWKDGVVSLQKEEDIITLHTADNSFFTNHSTTAQNIAIENKNGRIMVPLRFIMQSFSANVQWNKETVTIIL